MYPGEIGLCVGAGVAFLVLAGMYRLLSRFDPGCGPDSETYDGLW